ncbi:PREDICTED: torsin-1A-like isoform X1 [Priapulus caudatus]|uniref:Torsin n=1 Tax=Priapulus caudatus TaxID=37621 RepID=A0ABM1F8X8_PRICU|nr:PREDICTED: torsin-1A-like isoform X1 [Priapulus caudatus]
MKWWQIAKLSLLLLVLILVLQSNALEPITSGLVVGGALAALATKYGWCRLGECCDATWIRPDVSGLADTLKSRVYGQHLVLGTAVNAIQAHVQTKNHKKALVLSFHGWTGNGKNYVSSFIAEHLYVNGMRSKYVHLFIAELHFPHRAQIETYKSQLRRWITGNVTECSQSLFIFDEVDKMHPGIIDAIRPFISHYAEIDGVDYRNAIFIFLSNTGGNDIAIKTYATWEAGKKREAITRKEMEEVITASAFNEQGGLWHSSLIESDVIDFFLPFLPMERKHVKLCIKDDLETKGHRATEEILNRVANELLFYPDKTRLFSKSGCKRVSQKVDVVLMEMENDYKLYIDAI